MGVSQSVIAEDSEAAESTDLQTYRPAELHYNSLPSDMNLVTRLVIIAGLLFTLGSQSHGLRCWQCDSDDTDCSDTSNHDTEQCQDSESVCLRLVLDKEVTLDCVAKEEGDNDAQCYCDSDLCNGAPSTTQGSLLAIISLA